MSSIKRVCIYFTLILFVGGPGQALLLKMGIFGLFNRIVLYYNVYILYYTLLYHISLSTLQYFTMYCKNTEYTIIPRMFLL